MNKIDVREHSQAIQTHLGILQSIIQRMAANSASSKAYCVTMVSAILVIIADKGKPDFAIIAVIPATLFFALDTYYLAQEKIFRSFYDDFIRKYHTNDLIIDDLFSVSPSGGLGGQIMKAMCSFSIWPFYGVLLIMIYLAWKIVIPFAGK